MIQFSNPRLRAEITDYPLGGSKRGLCVFQAEHHPKRGWRVGRTTTGATKYSTYSRQVAIVDGSDGRTYILRQFNHGEAITVSASDFKDAAWREGNGRASVFQSSEPELYTELLAMINKANDAELAKNL